MGSSYSKMEKNKIILLTGASGGIGFEILKSISKKNKVVAIYNKNKPKLNNKNVKLIKLDLENQISLNHKFLENKKIIFINLAAIKIDNLLVNTKVETWEKIFQINVHSFFSILQIVLPYMIKKKWGRIISFSSTDGEIGDIGTSAYSASKYSLIGMNKVISKEYGKFGITCNMIVLGNFNYGMYKKLSQKKRNKLLEKVPNKKTGNITNIINAINYIINSEYVNGSRMKIDGGI